MADLPVVGLMWLSAILAFPIGIVVWAMPGTALFPDIQQEEMEGTEKRKKTGGL